MTELEHNVSRETLEKLKLYESLLRKWSPKINLVSKATIDDIWSRHILDSLQFTQLCPDAHGHWVDIGSGGGFPGLVVAIACKDTMKGIKEVTLVESDQRKAAFLRTVLRETETTARVISKRIESIDSLGANVLSARALASLPNLLDFAELHLSKDGYALFAKGKNWQTEVKAAESAFSFICTAHKSGTEPEAAILQIGEIRRV